MYKYILFHLLCHKTRSLPAGVSLSTEVYVHTCVAFVYAFMCVNVCVCGNPFHLKRVNALSCRSHTNMKPFTTDNNRRPLRRRKVLLRRNIYGCLLAQKDVRVSKVKDHPSKVNFCLPNFSAIHVLQIKP